MTEQVSMLQLPLVQYIHQGALILFIQMWDRDEIETANHAHYSRTHLVLLWCVLCFIREGYTEVFQ